MALRFQILFFIACALSTQASALYQNSYPRDVYSDGSIQRSRSDRPQPGIFSPLLSGFRDSMMEAETISAPSVCQTGFVEHCLISANQWGERRLLESMSMQNMTESMTIEKEFDGMCSVVLQFIDCLNLHHRRCGGEDARRFSKNRDLFLESWTGLCDSSGSTRKRYLKNAECIKDALSEDSGQEKCQSQVQLFFMSGQFSLDTPEAAVQFGCCAYNEWQSCIDSIVVRKCGVDAMESLQELMNRASGGLVGALCDRKAFARKSKICMGKKPAGAIAGSALRSLEPKLNQTLHKYLNILGDFVDRIPDDDEEEEPQYAQPRQHRRRQ